MRNHQYLELMGIDVWRRRPPRQSKAELEAVVASRADSTTGLPSEVPTGIPTGVPSDRKAGQSSEKVAAGTSNLAQVRQSLGVSEQPSVKEPTSNVAAFPPVQLGPSFLLIFTHFPGLTIASSYSADLARLPDHHQRFLTSLYFALRGEKSAPRISDFRWPMVKSAHISQSNPLLWGRADRIDSRSGCGNLSADPVSGQSRRKNPLEFAGNRPLLLRKRRTKSPLAGFKGVAGSHPP